MAEAKRKMRMIWNPDEGFKLYCFELLDGGGKWTTTDVADALGIGTTTVDNYAERHQWKENRAKILLEKGRFKAEETIEIVDAEIITDPQEDHSVDYWDGEFIKKVKMVHDIIVDELTSLGEAKGGDLTLTEREKRAKIISQLTKSLSELQKMQRTSEGKKVPGAGINITNQTLNVIPGSTPLALSETQAKEAQRMCGLIERLRDDTKALPAPFIENSFLTD